MMKELDWIAEGRKYIGLSEVAGSRHNPTLLKWLKEMGGYSGESRAWWAEDETPWCLTGDTEVLTGDGFMRLDEVAARRPAQVAMLNRQTLQVEFTDAYGYVEKPYQGKVYDYGKIGLVCDPGHRFFGKTTTNGSYKLKAAENHSKSGIYVPCITSSQSGVDGTFDDLLFLAAYLSDGYFKKGKVKFRFSKQRKMDLMEQFPYLRKTTEGKIYGVSRHPITVYTFDAALLRQEWLSDYKQMTWSFVHTLSQEQAAFFIWAYSQFDGTVYENGAAELFTSDPLLHQQLNYIATMAGYKSTPYSVKQVSPNSKIDRLYHVYIGVGKHRSLQPKHRIERHFDGKLYCLTVPSSVMIIRTAKGVIMPIGNCGLYTGHVLGVSGRYVIKDWYRASAWNDAKTMTKLGAPAYGCLVTFTRTGGGHVGFVVGQDARGNLLVLGGNQSNRVSIAAFPRSRATGYYWPSIWDGKQAVKSVPAAFRYTLPTGAAAISKSEA
ncbi:TIGR02594 family protein [Neisseria leonii]|uniref:TIGR02594 family protein n=1 Tax=Neisseria leonii TaxID=2995413 RepID=A0A9X4E308_9NEIS|nr:TIGR02594 family protein [Neisseria sp. 51.81]MDD9326762.1 TIGR02594 family protein [Neisseria sp. 51.81]